MDENTKPEVEGGFEQATLAAWRGDLGLMDLLEAANRLAGQGQNPLAAVLYRTWLQRNRTPHNHLIWFNLGVLLFGENDLAGAREAYSQALNLAPAFLQPRFNLGLVHERLGQNDAAIAQWLWIETHARADDPEQRPFLLLALNNLGRHHEDHGRLADALACLCKSLQVEPQQPDVIHHWVFLRAKQCLWPVYEPMPGLDEDLMRRCTSALAMISLSEDPQAQLEAARQFVHNKVELEVPRLAPDRPYGHERIRIGYCSGDLCLHPVAMLTVELFELHDRNRFEIYGFDWSREDGSSLRQRVIDGMDHFERIHGLSDADAAALIRRHEIDILVDLQGQTLGAEAGIEQGGRPVERRHGSGVEDDLSIAVLVLAHGEHPVIGKLRGVAGAGTFPGIEKTMHRLRLRPLVAHACEEITHGGQSPQRIERNSKRLARTLAAGPGIHQFFQGTGSLCAEQGVAGELL